MRPEREESGESAARPDDRVHVDVDEEFAQWIGRLESTYDAVTYTCSYRIGDPELAREVSFRVMSGMIAKPQVFAHYGLPYSGRIGRLAEPLIAQAKDRQLTPGPTLQWLNLLQKLHQMPVEFRPIVVGAWVLGRKNDALGQFLGCDCDAAERRRDRALRWVRALVAGAEVWL